MTQDDKKRAAALAAVTYVPANSVVGVGTGSTTNHFIDGLASRIDTIKGAVASSKASAARLEKVGIEVLDLNDVREIGVYVDGADETNDKLELIKGGGGALTREKIVAAAAKSFICIVDDTKLVKQLGKFPLPLEVIPMARQYVTRQLGSLGGAAVWRQDFTTDNGNIILDVHGLEIDNAKELEASLNNITGVVTNGLFARRPADVLLIGGTEGVETLRRDND